VATNGTRQLGDVIAGLIEHAHGVEEEDICHDRPAEDAFDRLRRSL
jgi:hypothetical protein